MTRGKDDDRRTLALAEALLPSGPDPDLGMQLLDLSFAPATPVDLTAYKWTLMAPGVRIHVLRADPARGLRASLVWADPGARTPSHRHGGAEVFVVLHGGVRDERGVYGPGDVCRSPAGSIHAEEALPGEDCVCYVLHYGPVEVV